jgi:hypothetical protein
MARKTRDELLAENDALRTDLALIGETLRSEAIEHELCSDYGKVVRDLNGQTSEPWLQHCNSEVKVTVEGQVTLKFSDLTVEVASETHEPDNDQITAAVNTFLEEQVGLKPAMHYVIDLVEDAEIIDAEVR